MERRRVMRGPAVNTGPLFRAIKQFPCTHEIMFLLFSIVATGAKRGGKTRTRRIEEMGTIRSLLEEWFADRSPIVLWFDNPFTQTFSIPSPFLIRYCLIKFANMKYKRNLVFEISLGLTLNVCKNSIFIKDFCLPRSFFRSNHNMYEGREDRNPSRCEQASPSTQFSHRNCKQPRKPPPCERATLFHCVRNAKAQRGGETLAVKLA